MVHDEAVSEARRALDLTLESVKKKTSIAGLTRSMAYHPEVQHSVAEMVLLLDGASAHIERIAQVSYDAGERSILELLDAYRSGLSARVRQAALDLAVRQAEIELEFASGSEIQ